MEREKILIAGDHKAFELKSVLIDYLKELGLEPLDLGTYSTDRVNYPTYALAVAKKVSSGQYKRGIIMCHTGIGSSIVANKFPRVRAALVTNNEMAEMTRKHNDSNILALGAGNVSVDEAKKIVKTWLYTEYEGGRHQARLDQISKIEKDLMHELDDNEANNIKISASLMCANQLSLLAEVNNLIIAGVDRFHIDIVDGIFANNVTMSPAEVFALRSHTNLPIEVHLMVQDPGVYVPRLVSAGADIIIIHIECNQNIDPFLDLIKKSGAKCGLALEVDTPVDRLYPYIDKIDCVLFLSVKTGFKAQPFVPEVLDKIKKFNEYKIKNGNNVEIIADGSVGPRTITHLYRAGVRIFVGGTSGLFKEGTYEDNIREMKSYCY